MKKITIGFLGNIYFDTRTFNLRKSLTDFGHEVSFVGYDWLSEGFKSIKEKKIRIRKLKKRISFYFYLYFFVSQFYSLIRLKTDIYFSADFYSLPASVIAAKLRRVKVYYDSREIYTELPALLNRSLLKKIFMMIEKFFIKRTDVVFTTGDMDSGYIEKLFNLNKTYVLRNLPLSNQEINPINYFDKYNIPTAAKIILYQGIIVPGRGIEKCFKTLQNQNDLFLIILGGGEYFEHYKSLSKSIGINERVIFVGKVPQGELINYTAGAFAGVSIINNISINNEYALPNKLFEYVMARIPVIASDLVQMKKIVNEYDIGETITGSDEGELLKVINKWSDDPALYKKLKENCKKAAMTLNWEKEFTNIYHLFS